MAALNQSSGTLHPNMTSGKTTWDDYKEVIAAGIMLLIGMSISFGSCASSMYKSREEKNENKAKKTQIQKASERQKVPSFILR